MKKIDSIIVVGGGTAGCIAALILKTRFPQKEIKIVESADVGIVGVGESSTEHWAQFSRFIGMDILDPILYCDATFKFGVYFENWTKNDFMHSVGQPFANSSMDYFYNYADIISNQFSPQTMQIKHIWKNELSMSYFNNKNNSPSNQYHFDTFKLNKFLHEECKKRNVIIEVDNLVGCTLDEETQYIRSINSQDKEYFADFFIDCSGFARVLMQKTYGIKWKSYSEYLPVNSAITFATDEMVEYNSYTKSTARNAGWSWKIPTQTRTGNGYVYCDNFISKDEAHQEMEEAYGQKLEIIKEFKFDPGRLEKSWHKNCYAVGLSQSFVEPLEATSIGSVIQQMMCFVHYLPSYDFDTCNEKINDIFDNIADYVQAHYLIKREDTDFWKCVKNNLKITPSLKNNLEKWKYRLPLKTDVVCDWGLFSAANYITVLYGLGWFDIQKIKEEYENYDFKSLVENDIKQLIEFNKNNFWVSHKKFIKLLIEKNGTHNYN